MLGIGFTEYVRKFRATVAPLPALTFQAPAVISTSQRCESNLEPNTEKLNQEMETALHEPPRPFSPGQKLVCRAVPVYRWTPTSASSWPLSSQLNKINAAYTSPRKLLSRSHAREIWMKDRLRRPLTTRHLTEPVPSQRPSTLLHSSGFWMTWRWAGLSERLSHPVTSLQELSLLSCRAGLGQTFSCTQLSSSWTQDSILSPFPLSLYVGALGNLVRKPNRTKTTQNLTFILFQFLHLLSTVISCKAVEKAARSFVYI